MTPAAPGPVSRVTARLAGRGLARASAVVLTFTLLAKGVAGAKEVVVAGQFGVSSALDAYITGFAVVSLLVNVFTAAVSAHLPGFLLSASDDNARRSRTTGVAVTMALMSVIMAIAVALAAHRIGVALAPRAAAPTARAIRWLALYLPLAAIAAIAASVCSTNRRFGVASGAMAVTPLFALVLLLLAPGRIEVLWWGMIAGAAVEAAIMLVAVRGELTSDFRAVRGHQLKSFWSGATPVVIGTLFMSASPVIDAGVAQTLGSGRVAILNYGQRLPNMLQGVLATTLTTTSLPYLSSAATQSTDAEFRRLLRISTRSVLALAIPAAVALAVVSRLIVEVLFAHGSFDPTKTGVVSLVQVIYAVQIPIFMAGLVQSRGLNALRRGRITMIVAIVNAVVNLVADVLFAALIGTAGIALSTVVMYGVSGTLGYVMLQRAIGEHWGPAT